MTDFSFSQKFEGLIKLLMSLYIAYKRVKASIPNQL